MNTTFDVTTMRVKRVEDIFVAIIVGIMLMPFMVLVAFIIRLSDGGSIFFKQKRNGMWHREFYIYKFRTMRIHEDTGVTQATKDDPRITKIGKFLRRKSFDELPQLFNVLKGEMSIVGPRPHAVEHNKDYSGKIDGYTKRHSVKPGMTGLAQVNGCRGNTKNLSDMEKRIKYDLEYIKSWSLMLDFLIIFKTLILLIKGDKNAY